MAKVTQRQIEELAEKLEWAEMRGEEVPAYCYHLGAEAAANGRKHMDANDRLDIALKSGYESWLEISQGKRDEASQAWFDGWREEWSAKAVF